MSSPFNLGQIFSSRRVYIFDLVMDLRECYVHVERAHGVRHTYPEYIGTYKAPPSK